MNDASHDYEAYPSSTSCAWPLIMVLVALLIVNSVQFISILREQSAVKQATEKADQAAARYQRVSGILKNLVEDLLRLSLTNSEAKEIVTQFNIRMNQPAATPPAQ